MVRTLLLVFSLAALIPRDCPAESAAKPAPAIKTETPLILKVVSTEQPVGQKERLTHEIFLQSTRFESLDALRRHLATLPRGTRIEYDYSCLGIVSRPLAIYDDLLAFQSFCTERGIQLELTWGTHEGRIKYLPK